MRLADQIAQCRTALASEIYNCATRYVLSDELTRLCTALAYSKGATTLACADLLHVPAERVWVEWTEAPLRNELACYGAKGGSPDSVYQGRRGVLVQSVPQGRRGLLRMFGADSDSELALSSGMEAYFDFDVREGEAPEPFGSGQQLSKYVTDNVVGKADILRRCFRFRFEHSRQDYCETARLTPEQSMTLVRRALGAIAVDISVLLAFLLLLATRPALPRRPLMLERLNKARARSGKAALLEQVEVFAPLLPQFNCSWRRDSDGPQQFRRLHHVRGHLVRRGNRLFWRVPHLRASAKAGQIRTRTVAWLFDPFTRAPRDPSDPCATH
jgi:hypothetical protein